MKKSPFVLAEDFKKNIINNNNDFEKIEVVKPGFINFTFKKSILLKFLSKIQNNFGKSNNIIKKKLILNSFQQILQAQFILGTVEVQYLVIYYVIFLSITVTVLLKNIILMTMVIKLIYF